MAEQTRRLPNILITGTPGTGKSTMCQSLVAQAPAMRHVELGALVKDRQMHQGWDEEYETYILDEERILDELEEMQEPGGLIVDFHGAELFPERWFDLVLVLRVGTETLYDRLTARGYPEPKLQENLQCEIMQVVLEEAREAYAAEVVVELRNESEADLESMLARVAAWRDAWNNS